MTPTIKELISRKSTRVFTEQTIEPEIKTTILNAAVQAPTAGNQQLYTILDITDQTLKETLAETCDHQPFIAKAPMVLIFCADCQKWYDAFADGGCEPRHPGAGDLLLAVSDAVIAPKTPYAPPKAWESAPATSGILWNNARFTVTFSISRPTFSLRPCSFSAIPHSSRNSAPSRSAAVKIILSTKTDTAGWTGQN